MKHLKKFNERLTGTHEGISLYQAVNSNNLSIVEELIESGSDISERNYLVIKRACEKGFTDILKYLLDLNEGKNSEELLNTLVYTADQSTHISSQKRDDVVELVNSYR